MKVLIVGNWKCNPTSQKKAEHLFNLLKKSLKNIKKTEVVICPPFPYLPIIAKNSSIIKLGAQNCFFAREGPFTGEISPLMLKNLGVKYVILGHSERRKILRETDEMINKKLLAVLEERLSPILCVGETKEERKKGETFKVLEKQIKNSFKKISKSKIQTSKLSIAYEPVWAIGTGNPCLPDEALTVVLFIRKILSKIFSKKIANQIRILYGGSVNSKNARDYLGEGQINGLLVGGASLDPKEFTKIAKIKENS